MNEVLDNFVRGIGIVSTIFLCILAAGLAVVVFVILLPLLLPLLALLVLVVLVGLMITTIYLIGAHTKHG